VFFWFGKIPTLCAAVSSSMRALRYISVEKVLYLLPSSTLNQNSVSFRCVKLSENCELEIFFGNFLNKLGHPNNHVTGESIIHCRSLIHWNFKVKQKIIVSISSYKTWKKSVESHLNLRSKVKIDWIRIWRVFVSSRCLYYAKDYNF
jgi:hypothetical protein